MAGRANGTRLIAGAFAAAAVAVPLYVGFTSVDAAPQLSAGPECLAWFGNKEDGKCLSYSNTPIYIGTPNASIGNPDGNGSRVGVNTGPLLPGTTFTEPVG